MNDIVPTAIYHSNEIADIFGLQQRHLWRYFINGEIAGRKIGRSWFATGAAILEFVESGNMPVNTLVNDSQATDIAQSEVHAVEESVAPKSLTSDSEDAQNTHSQNVPTDTSQKRQSSDGQVAREAAIKSAFKACDGGSSRAIAEWLNAGLQDGSQPPPARGSSWTVGAVGKVVWRLGLRGKTE